jgi:Macrocin-O-methyltransferase (TylF)
MAIAARLHRFIARSPEERSTLLRQIYRAKLGALLFKWAGPLVNRSRSPLLLSWRPDFDYDLGRFPEYAEFAAYWKRGTAEKNGGDLSRLYLICLNLAQVMQDDIPGDFVELGVYKGNSAKILHHFAKRNRRRLFLFDTFAGFDQRDAVGVDRKLAHRGFKDTSLDYVRDFVGTDGVEYLPGFFPESAPTDRLPQTVAVLHLDCDLREPMRAGLETFYPRMASGGLMLLHDYASGHWPGATAAIDEFFRNKPERLVIMPDKSGTAVARKL